MQPADLIALVSLVTNMHVDCDFTDDKDKLLALLSSYNSGQGQGSTAAPPAAPKAQPKPEAPYRRRHRLNTFSADRKLLALQSLMQALGKLPQKKAHLFSNGITQPGWTTIALRAAPLPELKPTLHLFPRRRASKPFPGGEAQNASLHDNLPTPALHPQRSERQRLVANTLATLSPIRRKSLL